MDCQDCHGVGSPGLMEKFINGRIYIYVLRVCVCVCVSFRRYVGGFPPVSLRNNRRRHIAGGYY